MSAIARKATAEGISNIEVKESFIILRRAVKARHERFLVLRFDIQFAAGASLIFFLCTALACCGAFDGPLGEVSGVESPIRIGVQTWISSGVGEWEISGDYSSDFSFRSRLEWDNLDSALMVLKADFPLMPGVCLSAVYGSGDIEDGRNMDSDWVFTPGYESDAFKFSESVSQTDGKTTYFDFNVIINWFPQQQSRRNDELCVDFFFGYQNYKDELIDRDGIQTIVDEMPVYEQFEGQNATYDFKWEAYRVGVRGEYSLTPKTIISADAAILLGITYKGEGFWNLRTDMWPEPPNLIHEADGGWGSDLSLWLAYLLTRNLSAEIGWKSLYIKTEDGIHTSIFADGSIGQTTLDTVESSRSGFFVGITGRF